MERPYPINEVSESGSDVTSPEWDRVWAIEASARLAQIESGRVKCISLEEAMARLRGILGER